MKVTPRSLGLIFSISVVGLLLLPITQNVLHLIHPKSLYGYSDEIPKKPDNLVKAFFTKNLQSWAEKYFDSHMGGRAFLTRTFNQMNFMLFHESNNEHCKVISSKKHGLYSNLTVNDLNDTLIHKSELEKKYQIEAAKLSEIQNILASKGKYFEVVIASSKAYVYPSELGNRYISEGATHVFERAASFGKALKAAHVNVIDSGPELRQLAQHSNIIIEPTSGLHWSYYAGCLVAHEIVEKAMQQFAMMPALDCGTPITRKPVMNDVDVDGYLLLNIWSEPALITASTYPTISPNQSIKWQPKIVFIGDSFSDHIRSAFKKANVYSQIIMSDYFQTRKLTVNDKTDELKDKSLDEIRTQILNDIDESDIVVLEFVDYNIPRWSYGFSDYFLAHQRKFSAKNQSAITKKMIKKTASIS